MAAHALELYLGADRAHMRCADMVTGNCETVASALAARVIVEVHRHESSDSAVDILNSAYASLESDLAKDNTLANHIAVQFEPARASIVAAENSHRGDPVLVRSSSVPDPLRWKPFLWTDTPTLPSFVNHHCLGVGSGLEEGLKECNVRSEPYVLPMYVLAYIWDACQLTDDELLCGDSESAVYSLH